MVAVIRRAALGALAWGCTAPSVAQPPAPAPSPPTSAAPAAITPASAVPSEAPMPPSLPPEAIFQLVLLETGRAHQIDADGTYRVGPVGHLTTQPPLSRPERGSQRVSSRGLKRLLAVAREARFFEQPAELPRAMPEGIMLPGAMRPAVPTRVALSVRDGDQVHTVVVHGHLRYPPSFGPLAPLLTAVDEEALGGWADE